MHKQRFKGFFHSQAGDTLLSVLGYVLSFFVCALVFALIACRMKNPVPYLSLFSFASFLLSGFFGGLLTAQRHKEDKIKTALFSGTFAAVLAFLYALFCGHVGGNTVLAVISYLAAIALGGVLGSRKKKHRLHR